MGDGIKVEAGVFRSTRAPLRAVLWTALVAVLGGSALEATELASARLLISGTELTISPESQTVPYNTPTLVETRLEGFDPTMGTLPADLRVLADFTGPEVDGILTLETVPNEPFRIPRLSLKGDYQLDNIRLVQGDELLGFGNPRSAAILVTQILITKVTSRALTLEEIRALGIVIDEDNFRVFMFTFGFGVEKGEQIEFDFPVILPFDSDPAQLDYGAVFQQGNIKFDIPQIAPFQLDVEEEERDRERLGGFQWPITGA